MAETNTRQASRAPVTLKIKFKSETLDQFIERYSVDISHGGIFIRTKAPLAVGTALKFEFQLKDASPLIGGEGTVVWTREHDPNRTGISPGMGVRFDKLPSESQKVLDKVLAKKDGTSAPVAEEDAPEENDEGGGFGDDFVDTPTRVAPADLVDSLTSDSEYDDDDDDMTPLPKPMPFHGDMDDFSDEAFSESTKVASLDKILAQAKSTEKDDNDYDEDEVFASTTPPPPAAPVEAEDKAAAASADAYEDPFGDLNDDEDEDDASERAPTEAIDPGAVASSEDEDEDEDDSDSDEIGDEGSGEVSDEVSDDDEEEDEDDEEEPLVAKAAVAEAVVAESDSGSSMPWIAVAAVILLIGGVGGFWLLNNGDDKKPVEEVAAPVVATHDAAKVVEAAIKDPIKDPTPPEVDPVEEPSVPLVSVNLATVPAGATLSLEGSDTTATSPASFDLPEGSTSTVLVSHPGFVAQSVEIKADGTDLEAITLVALPKLIRFTSTPPGAKVFVNGQKLPGVTPLDVPFNNRIANRAKISVQYRLPRHKLWSTMVKTNEGFVAEDDAMVRTIDGTLASMARRPANNATKPPKDNTSGDTQTDTPPKDTPPKDTPPKDTPPKDTPPKDTPPKDTPPKDTPLKDTPPKDTPPKDGPAKVVPPKGDGNTGGDEPTPDWMK